MSFITNTFVYYPISFILWVWHKVFSFLGGLIPGVDSPESNGLLWVLAVVFLVITLRIILFWPAAKQIRFSRKMQAMQPQMKALQKRYKNDRQKLAEETRKLQKKEGFNPVLGCLPMFIQIPVFLGLFHVLRSFNRMGEAFGQLGMTAEETRNVGNYMFNAEEVRQFLDARLFGTPLSAFIAQAEEQFTAFVEPGAPIDFERWNIWVVAVPLMIISAVAIHFNARLTISRQTAEAAANPQARIMNQLMLWVFPIGIVVTGAFWPLAILVYMVVNNLWTFGQQHFLYGKMDLEEEAVRVERHEARAALAPKVGAKPVNPKKSGRKGGAPAGPVSSATPETDAAKQSDTATAATALVEADTPDSPSVRRPGFFSSIIASMKKGVAGVSQDETSSKVTADGTSSDVLEQRTDEVADAVVSGAESPGSVEKASISHGGAKSGQPGTSKPAPGQRPQGKKKKKKK